MTARTVTAEPATARPSRAESTGAMTTAAAHVPVRSLTARTRTARALHAEWTKFATLRSQWTTPLIALALSVGGTAAVQAAYGTEDHSLIDDPSVGIFYGLNFGQVALACFGILLFGQEYASGTIRGSLAAVPDRARLYAAKLALGAGVGLLVGVLTTAGSFLASAHTENLGLGSPEALRAMVAGVLYHPLLIVICLGATAVLRNLTAAMGLITPTVFLGTPLLSAVPGVRELVQFLPDRAGQHALRYQPEAGFHFGHWTGLLVMALWAALATWAGLRSLRRHDA
ncbi:hypothetical protein [Kitasatospora camelliae]|uniref:ABC-2 family transporter n=1 Tax=Kitasatospora camelliae TaxID=3156397 RepID=A0AAU8K0Q0_9ACTN